MAISSDFNVMLPNAEWSSWSPSVCKAVKTYLWLIDKTTEEYEEDGIWYGVVLGGTAVNFNYIANDIGVDWATVRRHINMLVKAEKIRRKRDNVYEAYRYEVVNSWKLAHKRGEDGVVTAPNGTKATTKTPDTEERWDKFLTSIRESLKKATNPEEEAVWKQKLDKAWEDYASWRQAQQTEPEPVPQPEEEDESVPKLEPWESTVRNWNSAAHGHSAELICQAINHVLDNPKQREYYAPIFQRDMKSLTRKGFVDKLVSDGTPIRNKKEAKSENKPNTTGAKAPAPPPVPAKNPEQEEQEEREKAVQLDRELRDEIASLEAELKALPSHNKLRMYEIKGELEWKKPQYEEFRKYFGHLIPSDVGAGA